MEVDTSAPARPPPRDRFYARQTDLIPLASRRARRLRGFFRIVSRRLRPLFLAALTALSSACTTLERTVNPGRNPAEAKRLFVEENLADNHRLARRIAAELRARGLQAESGPLTMMPEKTEAVVGYEDRWTWDFGEHMTYLRLDLRDPGEKRPYATAYRLRYIANSTDVDAVVKALVEELLRPAP